MNKEFFTGLLSLAIGYILALGSIAFFILVMWNLVVSRIGGPRINIIDAIFLYGLFRLFHHNWITTFNQYIQSVKKKD